MTAVNNATIMGYLGADPDTRSLPDGTKAATLSIATTKRWKDKTTGETKEHTEWHRVVVYGRLAEVTAKYLSKGSPVYIEGELRTRSWQQEGVTRWTTEVVCRRLQLIGSRISSDTPTPVDRGDSALPPDAVDARTNAYLDDDIPF